MTVAQSELKPEAEKCDTDVPPIVDTGSRPTADNDVGQQQQHTERLAVCGGLGREDLGKSLQGYQTPRHSVVLVFIRDQCTDYQD